MAETIIETKTDLELLAKRLSRAGQPKRPSQHSPTADELADLKSTLQTRLDSGPMDLMATRFGMEIRHRALARSHASLDVYG